MLYLIWLSWYMYRNRFRYHVLKIIYICMYVCMGICLCMCSYIHTCVHILQTSHYKYIYIYIQEMSYILIGKDVYTWMYVYIFTYMYMNRSICIYEYVHIYMCVCHCKYACMCAHVQPSCKRFAGGVGVAKSPGSRPGHEIAGHRGHYKIHSFWKKRSLKKAWMGYWKQ